MSEKFITFFDEGSPFLAFDTMLLWGNVMPEEKAGQFLQSKEGGLIVPTLQMKELKHKVVLVVLPVSWIRPGSLLVCLPSLDMLFHLHCSYASQRHPTRRAPVLC